MRGLAVLHCFFQCNLTKAMGLGTTQTELVQNLPLTFLRNEKFCQLWYFFPLFEVPCSKVCRENGVCGGHTSLCWKKRKVSIYIFFDFHISILISKCVKNICYNTIVLYKSIYFTFLHSKKDEIWILNVLGSKWLYAQLKFSKLFKNNPWKNRIFFSLLFYYFIFVSYLSIFLKTEKSPWH